MLRLRLVFVFYSAIVSANGLLVTVDQGTLNGTYLKARNGKLFNAFYGIPFAKPPVGQLRFKAPVPAEPWNGTFQATEIPPGCLERADDGNGTTGSEDCLNLNVFTPLNARKGDKLAVMFYIYGGIFKVGNNVKLGPQYMMTRDLIIVLPNYRSGPLGFLSTGDTVIPGNFGLKDQQLALKWTRQNIHHFGGDPNQVTLQGHSSGAISAHLHTLSPASKGLFQQVIIQSGAAFCSLGYRGPDVSRAIAKELAIKAGCPSVASSEDMYECFMNLSAHHLVMVPEQMYIWEDFPLVAMLPTIEDKRVADAFITDIPQHLSYHSPNLPLLIGLTTGEGAGTVSELLADEGALVKILNQYYETLLPVTLQYLWDTKQEHLDYISRILKIHYFGEEDMSEQTSDELVQLFTHGGFGTCIMNVIHSYPGPKYVYWYDYMSSYLSQNRGAYYDGFLGVSHGDEVHLLFLSDLSVNVLNDQDIMFSEEMVKRWVNFMQTGNPNSPVEVNRTMMDYWMPAVSDRIEYLLININGTMGTDLYKDVYPFWKSLPIGSKYYSYERPF